MEKNKAQLGTAPERRAWRGRASRHKWEMLGKKEQNLAVNLQGIQMDQGAGVGVGVRVCHF